MSVNRAKPLGRNEGTSITTSGSAFALPTTGPLVQQFKIYVTAAAYVGMGDAASPPAASASNSVHQEATTEVVYTLDGVRQTDGAYVYVYAKSGTIDARVSFFG